MISRSVENARDARLFVYAPITRLYADSQDKLFDLISSVMSNGAVDFYLRSFITSLSGKMPWTHDTRNCQDLISGSMLKEG